jgi:hypothetical protein
MDAFWRKLAAFTFAAISLVWTAPGHAQEETHSTMSNDDLNYQQALQRGTQAVIWGMPAVSLLGIRQSAQRDLGATFNDIIYMSNPPAPRQALLTPTNQTPYVVVFLNTGDGPVVLDVPPASEKTIFFGTVIDAWQLPLVDVGPAGQDGGKGGKYLFLPPGYNKPIPAGYLVYRPKTFHLGIALRPVSIKAGTLQAAVAYSKHLRAYPLSQASAPPPGHYIDASPKSWNTLPEYDLSYFETLVTAINEEPVQARDLVMMGMLSSIGITKGQPFKPDPATIKALEQAAKDGYAQMQAYFVTPGKALAPYWSGNQWQTFNIPRAQLVAGFPFETADELLLDKRAGGGYFWLSFFPKHLGAASFYLVGLRDRTGVMFNGQSLYRLRVPKDVPVSQFWSATVYSMKTKAFFAGADRVAISSSDNAQLKSNPDGTVDLYFGPKPPDGLASNWISTGEDFFLWFRLYGPEKPIFEKTWTLPDVELVTQ